MLWPGTTALPFVISGVCDFIDLLTLGQFRCGMRIEPQISGCRVPHPSRLFLRRVGSAEPPRVRLDPAGTVTVSNCPPLCHPEPTPDFLRHGTRDSHVCGFL
jgi:hypothetical protein